MELLELPLTIFWKFLKWLFTDNRLIRRWRRSLKG